jgi:hypothetical protein
MHRVAGCRLIVIVAGLATLMKSIMLRVLVEDNREQRRGHGVDAGQWW